MRDKDLLVYVRAAPFQPFRIVMNSGRTFEVRHPEFADVGRSAVTIDLVTPQGGPTGQSVTVSLVLIEYVERVATPPDAGAT